MKSPRQLIPLVCACVLLFSAVAEARPRITYQMTYQQTAQPAAVQAPAFQAPAARRTGPCPNCGATVDLDTGEHLTAPAHAPRVQGPVAYDPATQQLVPLDVKHNEDGTVSAVPSPDRDPVSVPSVPTPAPVANPGQVQYQQRMQAPMQQQTYRTYSVQSVAPQPRRSVKSVTRERSFN